MNAILPGTGRRQCKGSYRLWILAALAVALTACGGGGGGSSGGNGDDTPATASVSIQIGLGAAASGLQALAATPDDVASVTIDVAEGETELVSAFALTYSGGAWSGTISDLPAGVALTFTAHAYDGTPTEIFSGVAQATLSAEGPNNVSIDLAPVDGGELSIPRIVSIAVPSEITVNTSVTVLIDLEGNASETLNWTLTAQTDGGSFAPASGSLPLSSGGTGTLAVTYTAPAAEGTFTHTIHVTNSAGNAVEADFPTEVVIAVAAGGLSVRFPPVVTAIKGKRSGSTVTWTATAAGDGSCCGHAWTASLTGGTAPALRDPPNTNPAFLDGYDQTVNGTVSVQVSDGTGLNTTATVTLPGGQFPDALVQSGVWKARPSMAAPRAYHATAVVDGTIYAIGGGYLDGARQTVEAFSPSTGVWNGRTDMPTGRQALAAVAVGSTIYAMGGSFLAFDCSFDAVFESYSTTANEWTSLEPMPVPRHGAAAAVVDGKIYLIGGENCSDGYVGPVSIYNPITAEWSTGASLPTLRMLLTVAVLDGIIYAIGGLGNGLGTEVHAYDPDTDTWMEKAALPQWVNSASNVVLDGRILVFGGENQQYVAHEYDPTADAWTTMENAPNRCNGTASGVFNGIAYWIGGNCIEGGEDSGGFTGLVYSYTP